MRTSNDWAICGPAWVATVVGLWLSAVMSACPGCGGPTADTAPRHAQATPVAVPSDDALRATIEEVLAFTLEERQLRSDVHAAWQILHGVLAYGPAFRIRHADHSVPALEWVLSGGNLIGWVVRPGPAGLLAVVQPGSRTGQGHEDQWLAIIAQAGLPLEHPIVVGAEQYTVGDLVEQAKYDVYDGKECSWTLIGLSHYLPLEAEWTARDGTTWTLERVIAMEAAARQDAAAARREINASACGGTHRLIGMTMALHKLRQATGAPAKPEGLAGGWLSAHERIRWAIETARKYQQPDGSFSVNYFARQASSPDLATHLGSTGHTLEFLSLALPDDEIDDAWVARGAHYLCRVFKKTRDLDLECGALYHAVHGLALYHQRRWPESAPSGSAASIQAATDTNRQPPR